jgi:hypothetical protein
VARPGSALPRLVPPGASPPMRPLSSLSHFLFPRNNFPLPLFHLPCPMCDPMDGCRRSSDPEVSSPFSSPLLSLLPLSPCAWPSVPAPSAWPRPAPRRRRLPPRRAAPSGPSAVPPVPSARPRPPPGDARCPLDARTRSALPAALPAPARGPCPALPGQL